MSKRIVILGAGESGVGTALLCKQQGYDVFVSDGGKLKAHYQKELLDNQIEFEYDGHTPAKILNADEVMKSPGISHAAEIVKQITKQGIPIISEIELAYRHKGESKIIGITGSNGKTTTTSLIYAICRKEGSIALLWEISVILLRVKLHWILNLFMLLRSVVFNWMISFHSDRMLPY